MVWTSGLQVVILAAGQGTRMTELIGSSVPKCLIPFGGNPLLFYPLKCLALNGFTGRNILVIIQDRDDIRRAVLKIGHSMGLSIDTFGVPDDSDDFGTAESIRLAMLARKITRDALIISCDVVGELPIRQLLNLHSLNDSSFTSLYLSPLPLPSSTTPLPGPNSIKNNVVERDVVGVGENGELVFMASESDLDEVLPLPIPSLKRFPNFKLITWMRDCHVYVVRKTALDLLLGQQKKDKHLSLKGEFLPSLLQNPNLTCSTLLETEGVVIRINSIHNYMVVSRSLDWLRATYPGSVLRARETKIGKGGKLIGVILGDHSHVGEKCRLSNVITLDHVKIEEGSDVQNTIISSNAQVGSGCTLKDCIIGPKYQVPSNSNLTNEHLTIIEDTFFEA